MDASTGIAKYDDVKIENCYVENTNRWGIAVGYSYTHGQFHGGVISDEKISTYGSTNVVIRNNYVKDAGGDAITLMYCDRPLIEYNISDGAARQINTKDYSATGFGRVAAGIWPWKCKDAIFQYNEAFDTCQTKMVRRGMQTMAMELFTSIITAIITAAEVLCSAEEKQSIIFSGAISVKMI